MKRPVRILLIDYSTVRRKIIEVGLGRETYMEGYHEIKKFQATNFGQSVEAYDWLLHASAEELPDLLIVNPYMEKLDGWSLLHAINKQSIKPELKDIPVCFLNENLKELDILRAKLLGVNHFIDIPLNVHKMFETVTSVAAQYYSTHS